jgi:Methyltransferase domain
VKPLERSPDVLSLMRASCAVRPGASFKRRADLARALTALSERQHTASYRNFAHKSRVPLRKVIVVKAIHVSRRMRSPWLDIPLADYEGHMSWRTVAQAELLTTEFDNLLREYKPSSVAIIGCAGGNGFDRISPKTTSRVVGVDINSTYIAEASSRYASLIPNLELYVADIQQPGLSFEPVDLIYAALVFEYVELEATFRTIKSICEPNGVLAVVLQLPSQCVASVSPSPFASLQALAPVMHLVPPAALNAQAAQAGFTLLSSRHLVLPSHKEFLVQVFAGKANPSYMDSPETKGIDR